MGTKPWIDDLFECQPLVLSERDWDAFVAALDNPPAPNGALKKLMAAVADPRKKIGKPEPS